ncbi:MAG: ComEC/Rec2 family competence protein [Deltaproteobacteria bacterium]
MFIFDNIPLFKIFLFFAGGIAVAEMTNDYISFSPDLMPGIIVLLILLLILFQKARHGFIFSVISAVCLFLAGSFIHNSFDERNKTNHFVNIYSSSRDFLEVKVVSKVKTSAGIRIKSKLNYCITGNSKVPVTGNLLIFADSLSELKSCQKGDLIICNPDIVKIPAGNNPHSFDPSSYFHYFNIHYQCFARKDGFKLIRNDKFSLSRLFEKFNRNIQSELRKIIKSRSNADLAISIILGDRQDLSREILTSFSSTGLTHVLSVSGMHVGIVALILNWMFSFIGNNRWWYKILKVSLQLSGIWAYSFLAGNEPAVMRAAFMISLLLVGMNLKKYINSLNILFGSAIILLLFNPFQLFQLSFLFSYSSMFGLLLFYQPIFKLINTENNIITKYLWEMTSLSLSSQVFLYPLLLYYFHNGPSMFILGSLIATPMSFAAMLLGFLGVLVNMVSVEIAMLTGNLLNLTFDICIYLIHLLDTVSFNIGDYLFINRFDLILIYILILFVSLFFYFGRKVYYFLALAILPVIFGSQFIRIREMRTKNEVIFYYSRKNIVFDFFIQGKCYHYAEFALPEQQIIYTCRNNRLFNAADDAISLNGNNGVFKMNENLLFFKSKIIAIINAADDKLPENEKGIDLLIVGDVNSFDLMAVLEHYKIRRVVITNKTRFKNRSYVKKMFEDSGIPVWDINSQGAFIYKI